jgi:ligand-binding sensor domain-containing protein
LNRYDGNSFKVYRHSKGDSTSLSSNIILCLFIDSEKNLWTGFEDFGAAKYNRELDNFTNYLPVTGDSTTLSQGTVYCIFEDVQNRIWMGTHNGLNRLQDNDSFKHYLNDANNKHSLTGSAIRCITSDENNNFRTPDPIP